MHVEKLKWKKNMFDDLFICQRISTSTFFFFLMQKCFIEIILVWEIIMIEKFWFNQKSLSGFLDLAMWKTGLLLVDMFKSCDRIFLKSKWHFVVWKIEKNWNPLGKIKHYQHNKNNKTNNKELLQKHRFQVFTKSAAKIAINFT